MDVNTTINNPETTDIDPSTNTRSVFFCPQLPHFTWDLKNTTFPWILVVVISIASPVTILLNSLIIVAVKRRKDLQKPVNILLSSLAVADLLVGVISMPLTATVETLILRQVSFQHVCTLESAVNKPLTIFLSFSSLYQLTAIAWERYMAIQKTMRYKVIVTKGLLQKLAIGAWSIAVFTQAPVFVMAVVPVDSKLVQIRHVNASFLTLACLIAISYFYIMVYLGVRKRKINEISQVDALMQAKLESKVARTTGMLTATLIFSFLPLIGLGTLGKVYPAFGTNSSFRFAEAVGLFNSLASPILYFYRDRQFRKGLLELLGIKKPEAIKPAVVAARFVKSNDRHGAAEQLSLQRPSMKRSAQSDPVTSSDCVPPLAKRHETFLKRTKSAPKLNKRRHSFDSFQLQQPCELVSKGITPHSKRMSRSKSLDASWSLIETTCQQSSKRTRKDNQETETVQTAITIRVQ